MTKLIGLFIAFVVIIHLTGFEVRAFVDGTGLDVVFDYIVSAALYVWHLGFDKLFYWFRDLALYVFGFFWDLFMYAVGKV